MTVIGFTTTTSKIKDQSELAKNSGLEAFGVSVIEDAEDKHDAIKASNAQLHLFMQMKRGNVQYMIFQDPEQVDIFMENIIGYYGKEKTDRILQSVRFRWLKGCEDAVSRHGLDIEASFETFEDSFKDLV